MKNRIPNPDGDAKVHKIVVVQTPLGILQIALPELPATDGEDPLKVAMDEFQSAVDSGVEDPLQITLLKLKELADNGEAQPLVVGLAILKQMGDNGMLPPMSELVEGTGINPDAIQELETPAPERSGIFGKLDNLHLN